VHSAAHRTSGSLANAACAGVVSGVDVVAIQRQSLKRTRLSVRKTNGHNITMLDSSCRAIQPH
jgi:hypothetical protein